MNRTKQIIREMLKENTGAHFLDSGGAYGRNWERNQSRDFDKEPACQVEIHEEYNELDISYNLYHYLVNFLDHDSICTNLEKRLKHLSDSPKYKEESWLAIMEAFAEKFDSPDWNGTVNTYNYDNLLSQVIQYIGFEYKDKDYIMLQIHGGCDVRGGYTNPRIFEVCDWESFCLAQTDVQAGCKNRHFWDSDNSGYKFYFQGDKEDNPDHIEWDKLTLKDGKALCPICKEELEFSVSECY